MKYATDFWYSRAIWAQSSRISPVASHGNPKPVDGGRYLCEQTPRREGDMHQVRESYRSRFDSQRKDNHCPSKLEIHSCPPQGRWAELVSGPSRAESSFDRRKRGSSVAWEHPGLGQGDHASLGNAEEEFSPCSCTQDPCHVSLALALHLPLGKSTQSSALELSVQPHSIESALRTRP